MELFRKCARCGKDLPIGEFGRVRSKFFTNGYLPICGSCLDSNINVAKKELMWDNVNKMCQWADVPFIPEEWEKVYKGCNSNWFNNYCKIFNAREFDTIHWQDYNEIYIKLNESGALIDEVPGYEEQKYEMLVKKWGQYDRDDLDRLEDLYNETLATQNVTTANQIDQLKKICKTSLLIDERISANSPYKDLMDSYEKLIKAADLTPNNTKNSNDFDSVGEVYGYLETIGWQNKYYDGARRDEVDETMKNIQNWIRKVSIGESTLTEEILQKLNNLTDFNGNNVTDFDNLDFDVYEKDASDILKEQEVEVEI